MQGVALEKGEANSKYAENVFIDWVPPRLDIDIKGYRVAEVFVLRLRAVLGNRNNKLIVYIFAEIFQGRWEIPMPMCL
mgnify:CR=1 FL=1